MQGLKITREIRLLHRRGLNQCPILARHNMQTPSTTLSATLIALIWRIFTATTTRTFFQPDEFYQSLEVAHHAVFGYGHLTWEWSANPPIRSIVFPALYMPIYWLLKATKTDDTVLLVSIVSFLPPMVPDSTLDYSSESPSRCFRSSDGYQHPQARERSSRRPICQHCRSYLNPFVLSIPDGPQFYLSLSSFFHLLCLGRTLSNSVETCLTTAALCFWPWHLAGRNNSYGFIPLALTYFNY